MLPSARRGQYRSQRLAFVVHTPHPRFGILRPLLALLFVSATMPLHAQQPMTPASAISDYVRLLELQGKASGTPLVYHAASTAPRLHGLTVDSAHLWSRRYPLALRGERSRGIAFWTLDGQADLTYNSSWPTTSNDGAAWAGRGLSGIVRAGAEIVWGPFTGRLYPSVVYAENRSFTLGSGPGSVRSRYAYPWQNAIDFPQRFGDAALTSLDWGQSEVRLDLNAFTAGFSAENIWWGPGARNAIIMGSAAPGFPHLDLGTGRPVRTSIGDFELRGIWGQLQASEFSGDFPAGGRRFITGLTAGYRPTFLPGLTVGVTRALYREWSSGGLSQADVLGGFGRILTWGGNTLSDGSIGNDEYDGLASLVARWVLPESGFEAYFEYARNDFAGNLRFLILQPEHARAFTVGFQKALTFSSNSVWHLMGEATNLSPPALDKAIEYPSFYAHYLNPEGFTHRGQLLGAAIGPGSIAAHLGLDRYTARGREGVHVEWIRTDDVFGLSGITEVTTFRPQQVDLAIDASVRRFTERFDWGAELELTHGYNRSFRYLNDDFNLKLSLTLGWH